MTEPLLPDPQEPKSYFEQLTGPGGKFDRTKYSSDAELIEAISKGKWHADNALTIKERAFDDLSSDHLQLRETMNSQASLQELIDQLRSQPNNPPETPNRDEVKQPLLDPNQLKSLISDEVHSIAKAQKEQANLNLAKSKLTERYGANYAEAVTKQLDELGMTSSEFESMAKTNPKLFERTFLPPQQTEQFQPPVRGTNRFQPQGAEKRSWDYYQKMKKDNPREYSNPKTQLQMMKDYEELGRDFEDGDFHKFN